ncbi:nitroreductase family deazaflavin-dependent oxidoreductase [Nocardia terpenica]|nr:nitroreductase family deazaflavin-dependent oxidoreductase [Nocardia terpenica]
MAKQSAVLRTMMRASAAVHRFVFSASKGRLLGSNRFGGMPVLMLTTTGRKSGKQRTTMLTAPVQENGTFVVVASGGGSDTTPAWFLNLRDNPMVEVSDGAQARPMRARIASAQERAELWPKVVAEYQGYEEYQKKTTREIPLVILEPA